MAEKYGTTVIAIFLMFHCGLGTTEEVADEERIIQILEDIIDAENFTYYRLQRDGRLRLELISLKGDVDIYSSSKTQYPSYDEYDMKSATCGIDIVTIEESMMRPVYIGLFGHPNYLHSKFKLTIYLLPTLLAESYEDLVAKYENYQSFEGGKHKEKEEKKTKAKAKKSNTNVEEEQPLWLKILLGILEFGIDVII